MGEKLKCFNIAGDLVPEFGICNDHNDPDRCCLIGDLCQVSGFCRRPSGELYQGGCTDRSYQSSACRIYCHDPSQFRITLCNVPTDSNATLADRDYCCDGAEKRRCCNNPKNYFQIDEMGTSATRTKGRDRYKSDATAIEGSPTSLTPSRSSEPISESVAPSGAVREPTSESIRSSLVVSEPTSESIGFSSALLTTEATTTLFALSSSTPGLNPLSSTSRSEAGPSPTSTCTSSSVTTESKLSQALYDSNHGRKIGAIVGVSIGTITILLGLLYLWYRRAYRGRYERRSLTGRHDADKRLLRITKNEISPPSYIDQSSIPASFRRNPNAMAVGIGLAIEMNSVKHLPNGLAPQPDNNPPPPSPRNIPGPPHSISFPPKAKTGPKYHSIPSSPTSPSAVSPSHHHHHPHQQQHTDRPILPRTSSLTQTPSTRLTRTPSTRLSLHPMNTPLPPAAKLENSRPTSLLRSSTFFRRHPNPLRSNPPPDDPNDLSPPAPDDDDDDDDNDDDYNSSWEQYTSLSPG